MNQLNRTCKFICAVCVCVGLRYIRAHISMSTYTRVCAYFISAVLCVCAMYLRTCVRAYTLCAAVVGASACARARFHPVQNQFSQRRSPASSGGGRLTLVRAKQHNTPQGRHLNRSLCGQSAAAPPPPTQDRRYGVRIVREATWRSCGRGFRAASVPARCVFIGAIERDCTGLNVDVHVCLAIGARTQVQGCCARVHV